MSPEWKAIFRTYTPDELAARITALKSEISVFSSQAAGNKNYTKDLRELRDQLHAAVLVREERGVPADINPFAGVVDFSRLDHF